VTKKVQEIYGIDNSQASESHAAEVQQISVQLQEHAIRMLLDYLRKTRQARRKTAAAATNSNTGKNAAKEHLIDQVSTQEYLHVFPPNPALQAIDTCLCKILAEQNETDELLGILVGANACLISELESFIDVDAQPGLLARVMLILGEYSRVLEIVTSFVQSFLCDIRIMLNESFVR
jgi:hypothetical protein